MCTSNSNHNLCEIKLRAERRIGEMLKETIRAGNPQLLQDETIKKESQLPKDKDGKYIIDRIQSYRYQMISDLPEETFENVIKEIKEERN